MWSLLRSSTAAPHSWLPGVGVDALALQQLGLNPIFRCERIGLLEVLTPQRFRNAIEALLQELAAILEDKVAERGGNDVDLPLWPPLRSGTGAHRSPSGCG